MSAPASFDSRFEIRHVIPQDDPVALGDLIDLTFALHSPMHVVAGVQPASAGDYFPSVARQAQGDGVSVVAVDRANSETVGFFVCEDALQPDVSDDWAIGLPVHPLLEAISPLYKHDAPGAHGEMLHLMFGGAVPRVAGQGVFSRMLMKVIESARAKGYRRLSIQTTHRNSEKAALRAGFKEARRVDLAVFEYPAGSGNRPFAVLADQLTPKLMFLDV